MFSIMLFIFLCFCGILAVLFYMLRSQERLCQTLRDEHAQLRLLLRAVEARLDAPCSVHGSAAEAANEGGAKFHSAPPLPEHDSLLNLSFDAVGTAHQPQVKTDPALDLHFDPAEEYEPERRHSR